MDEIAPAEPSFSALDLCINKKSKPGFSLLFKIYTKQKGGSAFSKSGFSFILLGYALE